MPFDRATQREICTYKGATFRARVDNVLNNTTGERREVTQQIRAPVATSDLGKD